MRDIDEDAGAKNHIGILARPPGIVFIGQRRHLSHLGHMVIYYGLTFYFFSGDKVPY